MKVKQAIKLLQELDENNNIFCVVYTRDDVALVDESLTTLVTDENWDNIVDSMDNLPIGDDFQDLVNLEMQKVSA
jgi:hypothetical protein